MCTPVKGGWIQVPNERAANPVSVVIEHVTPLSRVISKIIERYLTLCFYQTVETQFDPRGFPLRFPLCRLYDYKTFPFQRACETLKIVNNLVVPIVCEEHTLLLGSQIYL